MIASAGSMPGPGVRIDRIDQGSLDIENHRLRHWRILSGCNLNALAVEPVGSFS
jgi:hypothetical protein